MSELTTPDHTNIAQQFQSDEYTLERQIGQGGFGVVYHATHQKTNQSVAIKFLHLEKHADDKDRQRQIARFERECDFVCQLSHPNIVRLLDKGSVNNTNVFSVFEFVDGTSLNEYIKLKGALDVEETYHIMLQVLDALVHAHKQGIIHRDIKPSNIMLSLSGVKAHVKLLDFGISTLTLGQRAEDYQMLTMTQESIGTPTYCSPEQLRGELATFSSDLYLWGLVFLECLTGEPAIYGSSAAETYHKHLSDTAVPIPSTLLSHPLGHLLQTVLRKNASERVSSAEELYRQLDQLVISNLVGLILPISAKKPSSTFDSEHDNTDATLVLRKDDPSFIPVDTSQITERKQITTLALRMRVKGLEEAHSNLSVIETFFHATRSQCIDIARRYGGFHVGNLSDMTLFYFGHPTASDHDARLAARTALDIISLANKQQPMMNALHGCAFELNIGIHSDMLLKRGSQVPDGFANHCATDLAYLGNNKSILCSLDTKAILAPYYQFDDATEKHKKAQIPNVKLKAERIIEAFGFIRGTRNSSDLIGRTQELASLRNALAETMVQDDNAEHASTAWPKKSLHLYGEAGIGKSRLIHEFRRLESSRSQTIFQSLPEYINNALYPVISLVKSLLNTVFNKEEKQGVQLESLINKGTFIGSQSDITTILAAWLSIDDLETLKLSTLDTKVQKSLLFEGLAYLLSITQPKNSHHNAQNALYIFEDIHWADPTTLDFIAYLMEDNSTTSTLDTDRRAFKPAIVTTSRQTIPARLQHHPIDALLLEPLTLEDTQAFISELFDGVDVSTQVMSTLISRTDGIPLFIEELVSMLKRQNLVHVSTQNSATDNSRPNNSNPHNKTIEFVDPEHIDSIPKSLRESIQQKVDGLIYAKDTLQLAATIGRQFDYDRLVTASHFSELQVQNDLSELIENQLIIQQRHVAGDRYIFKHALVRDASYDSIDSQSRPALHEQIAAAIVTTADTHDRFIASELAQHYEKALQHAQASHWYYKAATEANLTFAVNDAINLYQKALLSYEADESATYDRPLLKNILEGLASSLSRDGQHENARRYFPDLIGMLQDDKDYERQAINQIALGKTYEVVHQHDDALFHYESANDSLLKSPHSETPTQSSWWKVWLDIQSAVLYVHYWLGNTKSMEPILSEVEPVIEKIGDNKQIAKYYDDKLHIQFRKKRFNLDSNEINIAKKAVKYSSLCEDSSLYAHSLFALGFTLTRAKQFKEAPSKILSALKLAEQFHDKVLQTRCCAYLAVNYRLMREFDSSKKFSEQSLALSIETNMDDYAAVSLANISWFYFSQGDYKSSGEYLKKSLLAWSNISSRFEFPFLWISHLHAISLCNKDHEFSKENSPEVCKISNILLDNRQEPLPEKIKELLIKLTKKNTSDEVYLLIEKLTKASLQHNYI
ncbi:protein kinase domain-containing protein [Marinomonas algicola]|uniref:protein kinase domain-containing protein n=1 Tax=Marinomonas algicola TaxID=2773454 RepID=UPI001748646D|nr:protein kinase [Marinomonas algicola]